MVAVSSLAPSSALMLLKQQKPSSIESFINSGVFSAGSSAVSDAILAAFHGKPEMSKQFEELLSTQMAASESGDLAIHEDNARHIALAEVIQSNRGAFSFRRLFDTHRIAGRRLDYHLLCGYDSYVFKASGIIHERCNESGGSEDRQRDDEHKILRRAVSLPFA